MSAPDIPDYKCLQPFKFGYDAENQFNRNILTK